MPIPTRCQKGFTLIEIIAVIVILGVIMAVAVPKFFSMTENAKASALDGALSEAVSRFHHAYTLFIVDNKRAPRSLKEMYTVRYLGINAGNTGTGESIGDFSITWRPHTEDAGTIVIYVESAASIPDLSGVAEILRTKELQGIVWSSALQIPSAQQFI